MIPAFRIAHTATCTRHATRREHNTRSMRGVWRRPGAAEEILLDVAAMAEGHDFYEAFPAAISFDQQYAWHSPKTPEWQASIHAAHQGSEQRCNPCSMSRLSAAVLIVCSRAMARPCSTSRTTARRLRSYRVKKHRIGTASRQATRWSMKKPTPAFYTSISESGSEQLHHHFDVEHRLG